MPVRIMSSRWHTKIARGDKMMRALIADGFATMVASHIKLPKLCSYSTALAEMPVMCLVLSLLCSITFPSCRELQQPTRTDIVPLQHRILTAAWSRFSARVALNLRLSAGAICNALAHV